MTILPLTYLGSTEWFAHLLAGDCVIDIGENWVKQTARNRCEILTSVGPAALTVPVHGYGAKTAVKDLRIDNSKRWQHQHWMSIVSAYRNSPFFDHYEGLFAPFYEKRFDYLTDMNLGLLDILTGVLEAEGIVNISENYVAATPGDLDLRGKKALRRDHSSLITDHLSLNYTQVFSDRTDFVSGLSIVDLLFCESGRFALRMLTSRSCPR